MPLPVCTVAKREKGIVPPAPHSSPPARPPGTGRGPWFLLHCGEDPRGSLQGRSLCVWWGGWRCCPQKRRCCQLRVSHPSSRKSPRLRSQLEAENRDRAPGARAEAARAGPALSPRPQRALLCSSASAIDSPLPLSGRWQRSPENGRGRGGPGDPRPRGPEAFTPWPAVCPARLLLAP